MGKTHAVSTTQVLKTQSTCARLGSEVGFEPGSTEVKGRERNH